VSTSLPARRTIPVDLSVDPFLSLDVSVVSALVGLGFSRRKRTQ
jgi:hypothetical protein